MNKMHWAVVGGLAAGFVVFVFLGWHFKIQVLEQQRDDKLAEKQALEQKLEETKERAAQFEKFQAEAENVRRDLEFYSRRLDDPLDKEQLYAEVGGLIQSLNLRTAVDTIEDKSDATKSKQEVTLSYNADLDKTGQLLNACVSQPNIVLPVSLELIRLDDPNGVYRETVGVKFVFDVLSGLKGAK
jgi:Tfp pilus assembly protein PilO